MIFAWILSYAAGVWIGGRVHRMVRYKLSRAVYGLALGGCILGLLLGLLQGTALLHILRFPLEAASLAIFAVGFQGAFRP